MPLSSWCTNMNPDKKSKLVVTDASLKHLMNKFRSKISQDLSPHNKTEELTHATPGYRESMKSVASPRWTHSGLAFNLWEQTGEQTAEGRTGEQGERGGMTHGGGLGLSCAFHWVLFLPSLCIVSCCNECGINKIYLTLSYYYLFIHSFLYPHELPNEVSYTHSHFIVRVCKTHQ